MRTRGFLSGVAVGAGLVYFLDPEKGALRRSQARERIERALDEAMGAEPGTDAARDRTERLRLRREAAITQRYGSRLGDITGLEAANLWISRGAHAREASDVLMRIAGGMLALYGLTRRGPLAGALRAVGAGLLASSVRESRPRIGSARRDRRRTVDIQKTIHIEAPVEQVYAFWTNYQNFPLFMSNIREIQDLGSGRSHWLVSGPGGAPIEWEAVLTEQVPNERIAWRSEPGSMLDNAGVIRFRSEMRRDHHNRLAREGPGLVGIGTEPKFAIGQRALHIRTPAGGFLWDCISLVDEATISAIRALGGVNGIAISHPHYYSSMVEWSRALGGVPIFLHAADSPWVVRHDPAIVFWDSPTREVAPGITLIHCGGHFAGATVLHWEAGADGQGALLTGDVIMVGQDRRTVSFMYSYPNYIPLNAAAVQRIGAAVALFEFEQIYGAWFGQNVLSAGKEAVHYSVRRYLHAISPREHG